MNTLPGNCICLIILLCLTSVIFAADITVPGDYATIQEAIDAANDMDTVIVTTGTYTENIQFKGKNITLRSTNPTQTSVVQSTVIDGNQQGSVVTFEGTETIATLTGFTVRSGFTLDGGGMANCRGLVKNNLIAFNSSSTGGGVAGECGRFYPLSKSQSKNKNSNFYNYTYLQPWLQNNTITANSATYSGGGIAQFNGVIVNCII